MILDWIKRQRAAAKQAKEMKTKALIQEQERAIGEFKSHILQTLPSYRDSFQRLLHSCF